VTGGAGFIGAQVIRRLLAEGAHVTVLDDLSAGIAAAVPDAAPLHAIDIRAPAAAALVAAGGFDALVHLAAVASVQDSVADPARAHTVNVEGTANLLDAAAATQRPPHVVFTSTGGVFYAADAPVPTPETEPAAPASPYAESKRIGETLVDTYARRTGAAAWSLRLGNVFGPGQRVHGEAGLIARAFAFAAAGRTLHVHGTGAQIRDYVYVSDVADAIARALTAPPVDDPGPAARALNIGTGVGRSVVDAVAAVRRVGGANVVTQHGPSVPGDPARSILDAAKARRVLGWSPTVPFDEGIRRTAAWWAAGAPPGAAA
jgi:UDP-glucose 4-epimerase